MPMAIRYIPSYVALSVLVAIFASYVALEFAVVVTQAKGRARALWLGCGAFAMGMGIWSMHFVGMLAFEMPGMEMAYDVPLMLLSVAVAIGASWLALYVVSRDKVSTTSIVWGGCAMAFAIAGMHYTGMYSMRMEARIEWNYWLVALSVLIALGASYAALFVSLRLRHKKELSWLQGISAVLMGAAIAGMHYTGMAAATFVHTVTGGPNGGNLLATDSLAIAVITGTVLILALALASSAVERALSARTKRAEENARLYQQAEKAKADLEIERDLRDRFMSALAHDLRTPVTAAMMSAQLAVRNSQSPELVARQGGKVIDGLKRMDNMIQDLLDAHRISAGKAISLRFEPCEVPTLLHSIIEDLTTVYGRRFRLQAPRTLSATWDSDSIRRAVENLCTNAVKYGSPQSEITVSLLEDAPSELVQLKVHNEGNAIPPGELQKLFMLFHRGAAEQAGKGWGLGLTIVKGIAAAHGGQVTAESSPEHGTTFTLSVPKHAKDTSSFLPPTQGGFLGSKFHN